MSERMKEIDAERIAMLEREIKRGIEVSFDYTDIGFLLNLVDREKEEKNNALSLLKELERDDNDKCPWCRNPIYMGHIPTCALGKAIGGS